MPGLDQYKFQAVAALIVFGLAAMPGAAQQAPRGTRNSDAGAAGGIKVQRIRRNVFMLIGDGANITLQVEQPAGEESFDSIYGGDSGVMLVDSGQAAMSDQLLTTIRRFSMGSIRYLINTSADLDHVGGNEAIGKAAGGLGRGANEGGGRNGPPLMILAHENVLQRMSAPSGKQAVFPIEAWPTDVYTTDREAFLNGGSTKIIHLPGAHGDSDSIVFLRKSDVISAGEIFSTTGFPVIRLEEGGHIQGVLDGLNLILELAIPGEREQGGTMIVPAHGRLSDEADVEFYREMVQIIHDRVLDGVKRGLTLDQVQAAKPALEYDQRYSQPNWTASMFVEAVYKDLAQTAKAATAAHNEAGRAKPQGK
jgi:glyoxylase-like metal-dependent hydrolase (beta-lactamase superfamily II)